MDLRVPSSVRRHQIVSADVALVATLLVRRGNKKGTEAEVSPRFPAGTAIRSSSSGQGFRICSMSSSSLAFDHRRTSASRPSRGIRGQRHYSRTQMSLTPLLVCGRGSSRPARCATILASSVSG
jgi:hypothetical protein